MTNTIRSILGAFLIIAVLVSWKNEPTTRSYQDTRQWKEIKIDTGALMTWKALGKGRVFNIMNNQTCMMELDGSQGVMLVSPQVYNTENLILRYKALALTPSAVIVSILAAPGNTGSAITIPENYEGGMQLWSTVPNYFFAFRNAPHGATPFITRYAEAAKQANAPQPDGMVPGIYYDIEIGKIGKKVWLAVNGKKLVDMDDDNPLKVGQLAFRLRGTAGLNAACLIRDVRVYTN
jgi:hypothetical protein